MGTIPIQDEKGGTSRGGTYTYAINGDTLSYVGHFADRKTSRREDPLFFVPLNQLPGREFLRFDYSNNGNLVIYHPTADDFRQNGEQKGRPRDPGEIEKRSPNELSSYHFEIRDERVAALYREIQEDILPLAKSVFDYLDSMGVRFIPSGGQLKTACRTPQFLPARCLSLPTSGGRVNSLKQARKQVFQLWVLQQTAQALGIQRFQLGPYQAEGSEPWWQVKQGPEVTWWGEREGQVFTAWLEFQRHKGSHLEGIWEDGVRPTRPDIVVQGGCIESVDTVERHDLLIECKEGPFREWEEQVDQQIIPYAREFPSERYALISRRAVPEDVSADLRNREIDVIDDVRPGKDGTGRFCRWVADSFGLTGITEGANRSSKNR